MSVGREVNNEGGEARRFVAFIHNLMMIIRELVAADGYVGAACGISDRGNIIKLRKCRYFNV